MFKNKNKTMAKTTGNDPVSANMIQQGAFIKGDIETKANTRIDGKIEGTINVEGKLIVGETGEITGQINCTEAEVFGKINGTITVNGLLSLKASSRMEGEVVTRNLAIEAGAHFTASCKMDSSNNGEKRKK
jgi:cytoskeletal protein CcmA (bactofilin family)